MNKEQAAEEAKSLFWGAVGECDCDNESARAGMDAVAKLNANWDKVSRKLTSEW